MYSDVVGSVGEESGDIISDAPGTRDKLPYGDDGWLGEGENMMGIPDPSWEIEGSGGETGNPAIQIPCPGNLQPNPDYDPHWCKACISECDIAHPIEQCEGSELWCQAINADALRKRQECYEETCGWRCNRCI
jgi:hypothetical protein